MALASARILIVASTGLRDDRVQALIEANPSAEFVAVRDDEQSIFEAAEGLDAIIGCPRHVWNDELLKRAGPSLKWVHASGAGCEEFLTRSLVDGDVMLTNGRIIQGPEVADHAVALLLTLTRNVDLALRGDPPRSMPRPIELRGKTAIVFGLGGIGMLVAERLAAFGMRIIGVNPDLVPMQAMFDRVVPPEGRLDVLGEGDAVICAVPHTEESRGMFGAEEFSSLKPTAFLVNVSRGALVDTDALVQALDAKRLAGAGLDVTDPEPLPDDHPLRSRDRVVITPHLAGLSDHNRDRSARLIAENVERFLAGLPLYNVVNKQRGY